MNNHNEKSLSSEQVKAQMEANATTEGLDVMLSELLLTDKSASTKKIDSDCTALIFTDNRIAVSYTNCTINGNTVNGTLILTGNDSDTEGSKGSFDISFKTFSYNNHVLEGSKRISYDFSNAGKPIFTVDTDMSLENKDGEVISHKGSKEFSYILTNMNTENEYVKCIGAWNIVHQGTTYHFKVTTPLAGKLNCAYITSGVVILEVNGLTASLDFGEGNCDKMGAVIYPNGEREEISW
ncbi:hypothetical protein GCM10007383_31190 [Arenibacter certesii]|uniref:Uncharacterized protein n=2 Tax=Arenibacter certesii TaxID=228955 RepID=A0A918J5U5_9FLAO|nr:hypothetical protein GCM10007383_31190 [Arenibacter certesii]